jgi:hypothetical protein
MTDAMLQNHYCVAVLQHRLSYNGSIDTATDEEGPEMRTRPKTRSPQDLPRWSRPRRVGLALAGLVSVAVLAGACGTGSPSASPTATTTAGASANGGSKATTPNKGAGPVTRPGAKAGSGSSGNQTTGNYSVAFAECMRAHGVPKFPNPNGNGLPPGADSGVNPASPAYQAALNGPCESLAPAGWVGSGPVTR